MTDLMIANKDYEYYEEFIFTGSESDIEESDVFKNLLEKKTSLNNLVLTSEPKLIAYAIESIDKIAASADAVIKTLDPVVCSS